MAESLVRYKIRLAKLSDCAKVVDLACQFLRYHVKIVPEHINEAPGFHQLWREYFKKLLYSPEHKIWLVEWGEKICGYAITAPHPSPPVVEPRYDLFIEEIFVASELRGRGIGIFLIDEIRKWGHKNRFNRIMVKNFVANQAAACFYKRYGFRAKEEIYFIEC